MNVLGSNSQQRKRCFGRFGGVAGAWVKGTIKAIEKG